MSFVIWLPAPTSAKLRQYSIRDPDNAARHLLSLLPSTPPNPSLALGFTTRLPPTVDSFSSNSSFNSILNSVIATHASQDPEIKSQAQAMASSGGSNLGSGGVFFPNQRHQRGARTGTGYGGGGGVGGGGAGGASAQGGMGGAGRGGYIHVFDWRHPPDFGRIPDPEDIFGSLEVDGQGRFVDGHGRFQASGTYRIFTPDGM